MQESEVCSPWMNFCSPCQETGFSEIMPPCHSSKHSPLRGEISLKMSSEQRIFALKQSLWSFIKPIVNTFLNQPRSIVQVILEN